MITPPADSIWECPCGIQLPFQDMALKHRRGWKKRPECDGKIHCVFPGTPKVPVPTAIAQAAQAAQAAQKDVSAIDGTQAPPKPEPREIHFTEYRVPIPGEEDPDDPEVIARRLNELVLGSNAGGQGGQTGSFGGGGLDDSLPPGDWRVEPPEKDVSTSTDRITVSLPITVRMYYDICRQKGWNKGDGSLSAFIADCMEDYFNNCLNFVIAVLDREELVNA